MLLLLVDQTLIENQHAKFYIIANKRCVQRVTKQLIQARVGSRALREPNESLHLTDITNRQYYKTARERVLRKVKYKRTISV